MDQAFHLLIDEKDKLLETMEILDRGFESLFAKIGTTIKDNKYQYQQQITDAESDPEHYRYGSAD